MVFAIVHLVVTGQASADRFADAKAFDDNRNTEDARPLLKAEAEAGNVDAMFMYANYLTFGKGGAKDPQGAISWYQKMNAAGDLRGYWKIGEMYEYGDGVKSDQTKARDWYCKGFEAGQDNAAQSCGKYALNGTGGPVDYALASRALDFAADRGFMVAQGGVERMKTEGNYVEPPKVQTQVASAPTTSTVSSSSTSTPVATKSKAPVKTVSLPSTEDLERKRAQAQIAWDQASQERAWSFLYYERYDEAWREVEGIAKAGVPEAQVLAGFMKTHGIGTEESVYRAAGYYRDAAKSGNVPARFMLNFLDYAGRIHGGSTDLTQDELFRRSGDFEYLYKFANRYQRNENPYNDDKLPWLHVELGVLVELGLGTSSDTTRAAGLYKIAADHPNAVAQTKLGYLWFHGLDRNTPNSQQMGMDLVKLATRLNYAEANRQYEAMSRAYQQQRDDAQRRFDAERRNSWGAGQSYGSVPFCYDTTIGDSAYYVCERSR
ncbi:MAG: hypothetical protein CMK07_01815 [Ponticaulis sp.]|nr:hypothetical protein [Ponticaulis sp.]